VSSDSANARLRCWIAEPRCVRPRHGPGSDPRDDDLATVERPCASHLGQGERRLWIREAPRSAGRLPLRALSRFDRFAGPGHRGPTSR
jgi:hypothetical protein